MDPNLIEHAADQAEAPEWYDLREAQALEAQDELYQTELKSLGPYRILLSLGHGGMGEVFLAERADQQFEQRVAIKLVKRGLISKQIQSRLRIERQILASLEHPNIARLLDGGATADGTPYIVMEYVDGKPIDMYCDEQRLPIRERLTLFQNVCAAVHSAHQNLIVHRDLKPTNILVTAAGVPKLLDFGIAKMLDTRRLAQTVALTEADVRMLTPDHASPEQLSGDLITTASDTYVLGVLLYELLTGCKPFAIKGRSFGELERMICEEPPPPPHQVFSNSSLGQSAQDQIALNRSSTTIRLRRELKGDLGSIILMALRKEPERRYSSVQQFSDDIGRYLHGLPVNARLDTWTYRATKFTQRHAAAVSLSAVLMATLIGFTINTYLVSRELEQERDVAAAQSLRADTERMSAQSIAKFLISLFESASPDQARGKKLTALDILDTGTRRIFTQLADQKELQAVLLNTVGQVYMRLGEHLRAKPLLEESWRLFSQELRVSTALVADVALNLGEMHLKLGDFKQAEEFATRSIEIATLAEGPSGRGVARGRCGLGIVYTERNLHDLAEQWLRKCIAMYDTLGNIDTAERAIPLDNLARVLARRGDFAGAEDSYEQWIKLNQNLEPLHTLRLIQEQNLATVIHRRGKLREAEQRYREVVPRVQTAFGENSPELADSLINHGFVLQEFGEFEKAEQNFKSAFVINEKRNTSDFDRAYLTFRMAGLALDTGNATRAEAMYRDALATFTKAGSLESRLVPVMLTGLSRALLALNRAQDAESHALRALPILERIYGIQSYQYGLAQATLGQAMRQQGKEGPAASLIKEGYQKYVVQRGNTPREAQILRAWAEQLSAPGTRAPSAAPVR